MDFRASCTLPNLHEISAETAAALEAAVAAGQPVTTKLIVTGLSELLRDEQTVADLLCRSLRGENAFVDLVRQVIVDEADQIAQTTLAAVRRAA